MAIELILENHEARLTILALHRLASDARYKANECAQDKISVNAGKMVETFLDNAKEAEKLIGLIRTKLVD